MVDLEKLDELKNIVVTAEDFSEPINFFFDHFGEDPQFLDLSKNVKSPLITLLLNRIAKEVFGKGVKVTRKAFRLFKRKRLVHGMAYVGPHPAMFFFFQDIDMGMISVVTGQETKMIRFTSYMIRSKEPLNFVMPSSQVPN